MNYMNVYVLIYSLRLLKVLLFYFVKIPFYYVNNNNTFIEKTYHHKLMLTCINKSTGVF